MVRTCSEPSGSASDIILHDRRNLIKKQLLLSSCFCYWVSFLEFNKTRNNIESRRQREELLGTSGRGDSASTDHKMKGAAASGGGVNRRADFYLKEHEHIRKYGIVHICISRITQTRHNTFTFRHLIQILYNCITLALPEQWPCTL